MSIKKLEKYVVNHYPTVGNYSKLTENEKRLTISSKVASEAGELSEVISKDVWYPKLNKEQYRKELLEEASDTLFGLISLMDFHDIDMKYLTEYALNKFEHKPHYKAEDYDVHMD